MTHPSPKRNMVPKAVLMRSGLVSLTTARPGNPQMDLQDQGVIDSGCSRHMTGNMSYLTDFEEIDRGYVAFGGNPKGGKITGREPISFPSEAEVARLLALTTPPPSPLTPLSSPLPQIQPPPTSPTYAQASLSCRVAMMRAASPPTHHPLPLPAPSASCRADIPKADIPHQEEQLVTLAPT
ncbi:hypothetical protein Tco_1108543 [Tanacetum coccineum]